MRGARVCGVYGAEQGASFSAFSGTSKSSRLLFVCFFIITRSPLWGCP